jgi:hypothetical protein
MKTHGTNRDGEALCGQANPKLVLSPKLVTCKRCLKVMTKVVFNQLFRGGK